VLSIQKPTSPLIFDEHHKSDIRGERESACVCVCARACGGRREEKENSRLVNSLLLMKINRTSSI
jgi:hypothetical protein